MWNLEEMTECVDHCTAFTYNNYGCWCGVGGAHEPVDGIDAFVEEPQGGMSRCCRDHDHCYDEAISRKECVDVPVEYLDDYSWRCLGKGSNASRAECTGQRPLLSGFQDEKTDTARTLGIPGCFGRSDDAGHFRVLLRRGFLADGQSACQEALCLCDRQVTACWRRFPKPEEKKKCNSSPLTPQTRHFQH